MNEVTRRPPPQSPPQGDVNIIKIPLLISGILNVISLFGGIVGAFVLVVTGILVTPFMFLGFLAAPFWIFPGILAFFELRAFQRLDKKEFDPKKETRHLRRLAIAEICAIVIGDVASLACGVIVLCNLDRLERINHR